MNFQERLHNAMDLTNSLVCVGLDPQRNLTSPENILAFNRGVIEATADIVCAYKPQSAFYEVAGDVGWRALKGTIEAIREIAPHAVVILDAKRGDVANTAMACAEALFEWFEADAATVNPYMGRDSAQPFLDWGVRGKGVFFLCRTSNPGSGEFQELTVRREDGTERQLFLEVAHKVSKWSDESHNCAGLVVGATHAQDVGRVRELCPDTPILLPGIGAQGGELEASVEQGTFSDGYGLLVSSSRSIIYNSNPREAARQLRDQINAVGSAAAVQQEPHVVAAD